ncbi:MAG: hypothetical protein HC809_01795 [Gammaproteobacteria bacterium]|nr:hypothetical protein [Gammaproteobacteria bacterium]
MSDSTPAKRSAIEFSDEQSMLLDTASSFFKDKSPTAAVRAQLDSPTGFDAQTWNEIVALGWPALAIPVAHGGSGLTLAEAVTIAEPMGRHLHASPLTSTQLFVQGVLAGASETQQAQYLARVCDGAVATVALFEPAGSWDLQRPACAATAAGEALTLRGTKTLVTDGEVAELLLASVSLRWHPGPLDALSRRHSQCRTPARDCHR